MKQEKRYPRGRIIFSQGQTEAELIEQAENGILYVEIGKTDTIFIPYHRINAIYYDTIPEEQRNEQTED